MRYRIRLFVVASLVLLTGAGDTNHTIAEENTNANITTQDLVIRLQEANTHNINYTTSSSGVENVPLEDENNDTVTETPHQNLVPRHIKSTDWNSDGISAPLSNASGHFRSLESLLDVFNPQRLSHRWNYPRGDLTEGCANHMDHYLAELNKGVLWALKMADASGRYTTSFFWGNSYWTGSQTLCHHLDMNVTQDNAPPFKIGFYTVRLQLALPQDIAPTSRRILMGLCLPFSCTERDVRHLMELSARDQEIEPRSVQIMTVKSPHNSYVVWTDPTAWILIAVTAMVALMILLGTGYDLYLVHKSQHFFSDNYTYEISRSQPHLGDSTIKLDIGSFTQTSTPSPTGVINHALKRCSDDLSMFNESSNTISSSTTNDSDSSEKRGLISRILLAFSLRLNLLTICDQSVGSDTIPTIHGLRSISMGWVILGHTCIVAFKYSDNMEYRGVVEKEFLFQTISNGTFSVDTFFFISGLLVSFLYFRTMAKIDISQLTHTTGFKSSIVQFIGLMAYRYGRLTVPYMYVLGIVEITMKWFYHNAVFETPTTDHINCPNYWWRNALYINTLFPVQDMCMIWSWYLADDTQFYVLGCILLILAISYFRVAAVMMVTFLISSWCTTAFIAFSNKHTPNVDDPLALFDKIYDKPWTRLGPYLVGMCVGWILYKTDCKIKMSKVVVVLGWVSSIACLLALVYGLYGINLHPIAAAAYSSLSHSAWALALSWIVIACSTGYGGYVNQLLSATFLYPFSRVTYCAYLVHPLAMRIVAMRLDTPMHLSTETVMIMFFGQVVASYIVSFIISLAFEAPIVSLLKIVAPERRKKQ